MNHTTLTLPLQKPSNPKPPSTTFQSDGRKMSKLGDAISAALTASNPSIPITEELKARIQGCLQGFFPTLSTPTHPPYASMIQRAIEELNEEGGSSEEAISGFIMREYKELPWGHASFLSHHLRKLCEDGDIMRLENGRYTFLGENGEFGDMEEMRWKTKRKRSRVRPRRGKNRGESWREQKEEIEDGSQSTRQKFDEQSQAKGKIKVTRRSQTLWQNIGALGEQNKAKERKIDVDAKESQEQEKHIEVMENLDEAKEQQIEVFEEQNETERQQIEVTEVTEQQKEGTHMESMKKTSGFEEQQLQISHSLEAMELPKYDTPAPVLEKEKEYLEEQRQETKSPCGEKGYIVEVIEEQKKLQEPGHKLIGKQSRPLEQRTEVRTETQGLCLNAEGGGKNLMVPLSESPMLVLEEKQKYLKQDVEQQQRKSPCGEREFSVVCGLLAERQRKSMIHGRQKALKSFQKTMSASLKLCTDPMQLEQHQIELSSFREPSESEVSRVQELITKQQKQAKLCVRKEVLESQPKGIETFPDVPSNSQQLQDKQLEFEIPEKLHEVNLTTAEADISRCQELAMSWPINMEASLNAPRFEMEAQSESPNAVVPPELCALQKPPESHVSTHTLIMPMNLQELELDQQRELLNLERAPQSNTIATEETVTTSSYVPMNLEHGVLEQRTELRKPDVSLDLKLSVEAASATSFDVTLNSQGIQMEQLSQERLQQGERGEAEVHESQLEQEQLPDFLAQERPIKPDLITLEQFSRIQEQQLWKQQQHPGQRPSEHEPYTTTFVKEISPIHLQQPGCPIPEVPQETIPTTVEDLVHLMEQEATHYGRQSQALSPPITASTNLTSASQQVELLQLLEHPIPEIPPQLKPSRRKKLSQTQHQQQIQGRQLRSSKPESASATSMAFPIPEIPPQLKPARRKNLSQTQNQQQTQGRQLRSSGQVHSKSESSTATSMAFPIPEIPPQLKPARRKKLSQTEHQQQTQGRQLRSSGQGPFKPESATATSVVFPIPEIPPQLKPAKRKKLSQTQQQTQGRQLRSSGQGPSKPESPTATSMAALLLSQNQDEQYEQPQYQGRGRPPKRKPDVNTDIEVLDVNTYIEVLDVNTDIEVLSLSDLQHHYEQQPLKRRLRRTPNLEPDVDTAKEISLPSDHQHNKEQQGLPQSQGRWSHSGDTTIGVSLSSDHQHHNEQQQPQGRGRGRLPKSERATTSDPQLFSDHEHNKEQQGLPQGQGRESHSRPKPNGDTTIGVSLPSDHQHHNEQQQPKGQGRGRPPKAGRATASDPQPFSSHEHNKEQQGLPQGQGGESHSRPKPNGDTTIGPSDHQHHNEQQQPKGRGRGRPPKAERATAPDPQSLKHQVRGRPPKAERATASDPQPLKRRVRGRPPKAERATASDPQPLKRQVRGRPPKAERATASDPQPLKHRVRGRPPKLKVQHPLKRRVRGRPPKLKPDADTAKEISLPSDHQHNKEQQGLPQGQGRGRHTRRKPNGDTTTGVSLPSDHRLHNEQQLLPHVRGRGRPPKRKYDAETVVVDSLTAQNKQQHEPKRRGRGRPPKHH